MVEYRTFARYLDSEDPNGGRSRPTVRAVQLPIRMSAASSARAIMKTPDEANQSLSPAEQRAREVVRRLISTRRPGRREDDTPARITAAACDHLYRDLSRWLGRDGCHALFARSLAQATTDHPILQQIQLRARTQPYIDGVAETIMAHGDAATAEGLEWTLVRLVELLGRLIGDDMATKLRAKCGISERGGASPFNGREEA